MNFCQPCQWTDRLRAGSTSARPAAAIQGPTPLALARAKQSSWGQKSTRWRWPALGCSSMPTVPPFYPGWPRDPKSLTASEWTPDGTCPGVHTCSSHSGTHTHAHTSVHTHMHHAQALEKARSHAVLTSEVTQSSAHSKGPVNWCWELAGPSHGTAHIRHRTAPGLSIAPSWSWLEAVLQRVPVFSTAKSPGLG